MPIPCNVPPASPAISSAVPALPASATHGSLLSVFNEPQARLSVGDAYPKPHVMLSLKGLTSGEGAFPVPNMAGLRSLLEQPHDHPTAPAIGEAEGVAPPVYSVALPMDHTLA